MNRVEAIHLFSKCCYNLLPKLLFDFPYSLAFRFEINKQFAFMYFFKLLDIIVNLLKKIKFFSYIIL